VKGASRGDRIRLRDMLLAIEEIDGFTGVGRARFLESPLHQRAVDKDLEIIGEAVRHLSPAIRETHPEVDWKALEHLRDSLVHEYFHTDPNEVWTIATKALPGIRERLRRIRA
jgi:uncharacterized protein with HEPN domain